MPRKARLNYPGLLYHVMARGIERRKIFLKALDYRDFLERLIKIIMEEKAQCLGWVLMPNHVHLIIRAGNGGTSRLMSRLLTGYALNFNIKYKRTGHLFGNRYKSIVCEEDRYLLELIRYVHLNPIRCGIVKDIRELRKYPWSGHSAIIRGNNNDWQETKEVLNYFGSNKGQAIKEYERFVNEGIKHGKRPDLSGGGLIRSMGGRLNAIETLRSGIKETYDDRILGSGDFVDKIIRAAEGKQLIEEKINRVNLSISELTEKVSEIMRIDPLDIKSNSRARKVSKARAIILYIATEYMGKTLTETAAVVKIDLGSASRARARAKSLKEKESILKIFGI